MKVVLGASGRLGSAICAALGDGEFVAPARSVYENWWQPDAESAIGALLDRQASAVDCIFVAAGVIDPRAPDAEHECVNLQLPRQVLRAAAPRRIRVVTFGTMMEIISLRAETSAYVGSKLALAREVLAAKQNVLHIRINTLYGGPKPSPHMFVGQMVDALISRSPFRMSPGLQLREYHHVDDDARAIIALGASTQQGVFDLHHGAPVSLAELARHTFQALGSAELLQVGALPAPANERFDINYTRSPLLQDFHFRDALDALPKHVRECVAASRRTS